ncbi:MAG: glycosyltransferase [Candidatus Limiplasma sp.]|nr:glycosyltransferase [Candidatus Limiplasma sp.]
MSTLPILSIIVPVYNPPTKSFTRCMDSLLKQTLPSLEILLVDDGSAEECRAACDRFASENATVRVIHQDNAGVSTARNRGIDAASGQYVAFVDADDDVEPEYAETLLAAIDGCDLVICGMLEQRYDMEDRHYDVSSFFAFPELHSGVQYINFCVNKLFRATIIRQNKVRFDPSVKLGEDALFFAEYVRYCQSIRCISQSLYHYRVTPGSAMRSFNPLFWSWEKRLIHAGWRLFTQVPLDPVQNSFLLGWLYGKFKYAFFYYLSHDWRDRHSLVEISRDPLYSLLLKRARDNALREFCPKAKLTLMLWRSFGLTGVVFSFWMIEFWHRLHSR